MQLCQSLLCIFLAFRKAGYIYFKSASAIVVLFQEVINGVMLLDYKVSMMKTAIDFSARIR